MTAFSFLPFQMTYYCFINHPKRGGSEQTFSCCLLVLWAGLVWLHSLGLGCFLQLPSGPARAGSHGFFAHQGDSRVAEAGTVEAAPRLRFHVVCSSFLGLGGLGGPTAEAASQEARAGAAGPEA